MSNIIALHCAQAISFGAFHALGHEDYNIPFALLLSHYYLYLKSYGEFRNEKNEYAVAIRTGTIRRVWFAIRTAVGIFLAIVREIFVFFDFYNLTLINQQKAIAMGCIFVFKIDLSVLYVPYRRDTFTNLINPRYAYTPILMINPPGASCSKPN